MSYSKKNIQPLHYRKNEVRGQLRGLCLQNATLHCPEDPAFLLDTDIRFLIG